MQSRTIIFIRSGKTTHIRNGRRRNGKRRNGRPKAQKSGRKHWNRSEYQSGTMDLSWTIVWTNFGRT